MKSLQSRAQRAAKAFGEMKARGIATNTAKVAAVGGAVLASGQSFALDAAQNTAITDAYTGTGDTVTLIIAGLLGVGLIITGFGIIWSLVKR